jgi:hypothetical protein
MDKELQTLVDKVLELWHVGRARATRPVQFGQAMRDLIAHRRKMRQEERAEAADQEPEKAAAAPAPKDPAPSEVSQPDSDRVTSEQGASKEPSMKELAQEAAKAQKKKGKKDWADNLAPKE